uniref:Yeast RAD10 gene involved in the excision repair of DNA n=1 Tax=Saccharomyces cerevisiae TaxID=4932 RepID=E9PA16_YEASX|nr:unnamed protein product [Saccharomyces cerevisiae]
MGISAVDNFITYSSKNGYLTSHIMSYYFIITIQVAIINVVYLPCKFLHKFMGWFVGKLVISTVEFICSQSAE